MRGPTRTGSMSRPRAPTLARTFSRNVRDEQEREGPVAPLLFALESPMTQFYPGQQVIASDGARYTLTHWGVRAGGAALPRPVNVRYPCWGGDDDRAGADCAMQRVRRRGASRGHRERRV